MSSFSIFSIFHCCIRGQSKPRKHVHGSSDQLKRKSDGPKEGKESLPEAGAVGEQELEYKSTPIPTDETASEGGSEMTAVINGSGETDAGKSAQDDSSLHAPESVQVIEVDSNGDTKAGEIGVGGRLNLKLSLPANQNKLNVKVSSVEFPAFQEWKLADLEVSCMLLPFRQHSFRTRPKKFDQPFQVVLGAKKDMPKTALRFRLYDHKPMSKKYMIGQGVVGLGNLKLGPEELRLALNLTPPETYAIDGRYIGDVAGHQEGINADERKPEILFSLEYRALTRKLIVEVIKTRNIGLLTKSKPQDLAVEVKFLDDKNRVQRICNTNSKRHVIDTEFNEMFMFRVTADKLHGVTLVTSLIANPEARGKKEKIAEVCMGRLSSSHEQQSHWDAAVQNPGSLITRWHSLFK